MIKSWTRAAWAAGAWGATLLALPAAPATRSIVPPEAQMNDAEARLAYARILAYRPATWAEAETSYIRILREEPGHPSALTELAELNLRQGKFADAEQRLAEARRLHPGDPATTAALARLYLWTGRPAEAVTILENVRRARPLGAAEQMVYGQALTRAGRLADANREFDAALAAGATPELLSAAADARLAGGDLAVARDLYQRALAGDASLSGAQRGYALTLAWTGQERAALPGLEAALRAQPDDDDVIHSYLSALRGVEGETAALAQARAHAEAAPRDARWRAEWAELEAARGHAVRSRDLFTEALALGRTPALELRASRAAITWGDFNGAERGLREALRRQPADIRTRDELGRLLVSADRTEEAEQFYEQWLLDAPGAEPARLGLVRVALKEKNFVTALARGDALLATRPELPEAWRLKAEALRGLHRSAEAATWYGRLATVPEQRVDAEVGQGRMAFEAGDRAGATTHFAAALAAGPETPAARFFAAAPGAVDREEFIRAVVGEEGPAADSKLSGPPMPPESAGRLVKWAGLYAERGDFGRAVRCLRAARRADPDYYPAWAQYAEFLAIDAQFDASLREFGELGKVMPDNRQVRLGEARALAWSRHYPEALDAYAALAALNAADPVPRREAARTAGWGKLRERGAALYATAWAEPVDRRLAALLAPVLEGAGPSDLVTYWQRWASQPVEGAEPFAGAERFAAERFTLREALPENRRARLDRVCVEILPAFRLQRSWWLENRAKQLVWDRRFTSAEATFNRLLVFEPGNEEALFDLSQTQAAQGLGARERVTLDRLLQLDPNHSLANHAVERRRVRSRPLASVEGRTWREHGRGELASLQRYAVAGELEDRFADQIQVGVLGMIGREAPTTRPGAFAYRGIGFETSAVLGRELSASASALHREFYDGRIGHADSGQAQLWLRHDSHAFGIGYEKREELTNGFALLAGTRSDNLWMGGTAVLSRRLDADFRLASIRYSDGNTGTNFVLRPAYAWTDHPRAFKTILTLEYRDTADATVYVLRGGQLANLIHPYWTPQDYWHEAVTLEWSRDLAREYFIGSADRSYDIRATLGYDSESNTALTLEADWHWEWVDRWVAHAGVYGNLSREWDALGLRLRVARRF
jgi:predicted Zn-dependent protease